MDYTVAAVDEAIRLLFLVSDQPGNGVTELAKRSGITKARAYRLLTTLEQRGLVQRQGDAALYYLGFGAHQLGTSAVQQIDLVRVAREPLAALGSALNETVMVRVRDGLESLCVARYESTQSVRVHGEVGHRRPLYAGASSKLLLAHAPEDVLKAVLAQQREHHSAETLVEPARLRTELALALEQGFATSHGERSADVVAIATPILNARGEVIASLSVSAPASRLPRAKVPAHLRLLQSTAGEISKALGYRPGHG